MFLPRTCQTIQNSRQLCCVGSSAAYKFANMKFHDFPGHGPKFHDFPGLESKLSNSMTFQIFQVFQDRYEPWLTWRRHAEAFAQPRDTTAAQ